MRVVFWLLTCGIRWWVCCVVVGPLIIADVDECAERLDSCVHGMEMCINDLGRYHCEPLSADAASTTTGHRHHDVENDHHNVGLCPPGYTYDEDEQVCIGQLI